MSCIINALKGDDRYLQRTAHKAMQSFQMRVEAEPEATATLLEDLLRATNFVDFDKLTKTKTMEKLLGSDAQLSVAKILGDMHHLIGTEIVEDAAARRRQLILLQGRFFTQWMSRPENVQPTPKNVPNPASPLILSYAPPLEVLRSWIEVAYFTAQEQDPAFSDETRGVAKAKLSTHLEQTLKAGALGKEMLRAAIGEINEREKNGEQSVIAFAPAVKSIIDHGWQRFESLGVFSDSSGDIESADFDGKNTPFREGLLLLYCLTLFQVYNGDAEAVEILEDLITYHEQYEAQSIQNDSQTAEDQSDALIEILLSFASKPSKFLRRMINIIFEGFAPQVTSKGLESLLRILATKESVEGQQEMFDAADEDANSQDEDEEDASDVEMVDSDVEVVSVSSSSESDSEDDEADTGTEDSEDEELAAFDAKLAAALGTRKLTNGATEGDDSSSTSGASDTDMDDDQMLTLDQKLAEVFRARQQETSKKQTKKDARETIINFKNRILDLLDIYLKAEPLASQSLYLLPLPLLTLARRTKTKQLADRACTILNDYCKRCKGVNVPACTDHVAGLELLRSLHAEAATGASNAHANAASHASILVVKSLVNSGVGIGEVVDVYALTQKRMLTERKWKVQAGLFTDWNNWCVSARERFAE
jgi:DNA polymerase phi